MPYSKNADRPYATPDRFFQWPAAQHTAPTVSNAPIDPMTMTGMRSNTFTTLRILVLQLVMI